MTNDIARRLKAHASGRGARFTRSFGVVRLRYAEPVPSRSKALRREAAVKRLTRKQKLELVEQHPPEPGVYTPGSC